MKQIYIVKKGDTLWGISSKYLGSPLEWPRIWRHNNRKNSIEITGRGIPDPDLIYPGQKLLIPDFPGMSTKFKAVAEVNKQSPNKSLHEQLPKIKTPISLNYQLDDIKLPPMILPNAVVEIKLEGSVALSSVEKYPVDYVVNKKQLEAKVTEQANHALGSLIGETKLNYDETRKTLTLGCKLVTKSKTPNLPSTAVGVEMSSNSPVPKLKFEFSFPQLKGSINNFHYVATGVNYILEVTPKKIAKDTQTKDIYKPESASESRWDAVGYFAAATAIVAATLVEDFFSLGAGVADDPATLTVAAGMATRGWAIWSSTNTVVQRVVVPAAFRFIIHNVPRAALRYGQ